MPIPAADSFVSKESPSLIRPSRRNQLDPSANQTALMSQTREADVLGIHAEGRFEVSIFFFSLQRR